MTVAVCIGVSHYADAVIGPLPGAAREVAEIAAALIAETGCALNPARVEAIGKERAPTTTEIVEALKRGTARAGPEDVLFVYFSGHAFRDGTGESEIYLCGQETR